MPVSLLLEEQKISPFLLFIYNFIEYCSSHQKHQLVCRWSDDGLSFLIIDGDQLMDLIQEFQEDPQNSPGFKINTKNFISLRRNLNYYRFSISRHYSSLDKQIIVHVHHPTNYFQRYNPELYKIKTSFVDKSISLKNYNQKRSRSTDMSSDTTSEDTRSRTARGTKKRRGSIDRRCKNTSSKDTRSSKRRQLGNESLFIKDFETIGHEYDKSFENNEEKQDLVYILGQHHQLLVGEYNLIDIYIPSSDVLNLLEVNLNQESRINVTDLDEILSEDNFQNWIDSEFY